jgi:glyoxylase-like metal-dependent hydrolase (beta-lactamase superfamily II)
MTRLACSILTVLLASSATAAPQAIAPQVTLIPGAVPEGRGPDGNTVVIEAPEGLIVVDTGRHAEHTDKILSFAKESGRPIVAVVNTHWHLDHTSGNRRIKAAFPQATVYATNAVDGALKSDGFLMREFAKMPGYLKDASLSDIQHDEVRIAIDTMEHRDSLRPDVVVGKSGTMRLAGRALDVRVTDGAVTDADIWLLDPATQTVVLGDLVTFPAPFFETACPAKWKQALSEVVSLSFRTAIPGHGSPMTHEDVESYRQAFNGFLDCVATDAKADACAAGWSNGITKFLADDAARRTAKAYAAYYSGFLRTNKMKSPDCKAG